MSDNNALAAKVADAVMDAIEHHGRINRDDLIAAAAGAIAQHEIARGEVSALAKRKAPEDKAVAAFQERARQSALHGKAGDGWQTARDRALVAMRELARQRAERIEKAPTEQAKKAGDSGMPDGWRHEKQAEHKIAGSGPYLAARVDYWEHQLSSDGRARSVAEQEAFQQAVSGARGEIMRFIDRADGERIPIVDKAAVCEKVDLRPGAVPGRIHGASFVEYVTAYEAEIEAGLFDKAKD